MKIALTHPFCWPYVRRGAEHFMAELARDLTARGHDVATISSKPGPKAIERTPSGTRLLYRQFWTPALARGRLQPFHSFLLTSSWGIQRVRPDLVQSLFYIDAWSSHLTAYRTGHKTVYYVTGPPIPRHLPRLPPDRWILRKAIERADELLVPSKFMRDVVLEHYGRKSRIAPVPIDLASFSHPKPLRREHPVVLCVAAFDDRRKGARILVRAFAELKRRHPPAVLRLSGQISDDLRKELGGMLPHHVLAAIEFLGVGRPEDLPRLYADASVTVLPAIWESYGLALLESWACGTPVVAANHAALPELVDDERLGALFDPGRDGEEAQNVSGLVQAIEKGLELASRDETSERCRERARRYSWDRIGGAFERVYQEVLGIRSVADR